MSVTGGIVRYEDGVKTTMGDQFSPTRKVAVELHFSTSEDGDGEGETQVTLDKAQAFVNGKLGINTPTPAARTKADLEAEAVAKAEKPKRGPGRPKVDAPVVEAVAASAPTSEPTDEWATAPVTEITDKDLNDEVQKKNAVLKDPVKIRTLIATFSPDPKKPFTLREIPQGQRQTFIDKLKALA